MVDRYLTINTASVGIYSARGSKFLSFAYPVNNVEQIKPILIMLRNQYFDARHCCYAYRIGCGGKFYRMNDDGEPHNTAGRPIYNTLLSHQLTNILVVVVRYFGGILLGVSGLIDAYKKSTEDVINNSKIITEVWEQSIVVCCSEKSKNKVMQYVKKERFSILFFDFIGQEYQIRVNVPISKVQQVKSDFLKEQHVKILE